MDAPADEEIRRVYEYISANPGSRRGDILKASRRLGMRRERIRQRWPAIRSYLRGEVSAGRLPGTRNDDGETWIFGHSTNDAGRYMRYYAVDPKRRFSYPTTEPEVYELEAAPAHRYEPEPRFEDETFITEADSDILDAFNEGAIAIIDEPEVVDVISTDPPFTAEPIAEPTPPPTDEWVRITVRGVVIEVKSGTTIRLE